MMRINRLLVIPGIVVGLAIFATPVFAEDISTGITGSVNIQAADTSISTDTNIKTPDSENDTTANNKHAKTEVQTEVQANATESTAQASSKESKDSNESSMRLKGEKEVADLRKDHKVPTADQRQKFCNMDKNGLTTKFNAIQTNAQRADDKIGSVYTKADAFNSAHHLQPVDYAALVATVASDKTATDGAIAALVAPKLDCTSATVATDVATFKVAAEQVRTDLQAYRKDVRALIGAIKTAALAAKPTASANTTTTTTGGTN